LAITTETRAHRAWSLCRDFLSGVREREREREREKGIYVNFGVGLIFDDVKLKDVGMIMSKLGQMLTNFACVLFFCWLKIVFALTNSLNSERSGEADGVNEI
jgi:hypothetical protein